jgi:hypothetical protein
MKIVPGSVADQLMRNRPAFLDGTSSRGSSLREICDDKQQKQRRSPRREKAGPYATELLATYLDQQANESENVCMEEQRVEAWPRCPSTMAKPVAVKGSLARRAAVLCLERVTHDGDVELLSDHHNSESASSPSPPSPSHYRKDGSMVKSVLRTRRESDESYQSTLASSSDENCAVQAMITSSRGECPSGKPQYDYIQLDRFNSATSVEARVGSALIKDRKRCSHHGPAKMLSSSSDGSSKIPAGPCASVLGDAGVPVWFDIDEKSEEGCVDAS